MQLKLIKTKWIFFTLLTAAQNPLGKQAKFTSSKYMH